MAVLVHSQDVQIVKIEENAVNVEKDMENGLTHVKQAVVHARNARKWRWVCCGLMTVIIVRFFPASSSFFRRELTASSFVSSATYRLSYSSSSEWW
jgi:hypothetical protein